MVKSERIQKKIVYLGAPIEGLPIREQNLRKIAEQFAEQIADLFLEEKKILNLIVD